MFTNGYENEYCELFYGFKEIKIGQKATKL